MKNIKKHFVKCILTFFKPIFSLLDIIYTKQKGKVFFGDNNMFCDNPKYLFEYMIKNSVMSPVWFTRNENVYNEIRKKYGDNKVILATGLFSILKLIHNYLIASFVIIKVRDDFWYLRKIFKSSRRIIINVSHGIPVKKTGILISSRKNDSKFEKKNYKKKASRFTYCIFRYREIFSFCLLQC